MRILSSELRTVSLYIGLNDKKMIEVAVMKTFDLVVLGGGTGGYVAAIRASQLGLNVVLVEKAKLGGTCLHAGCIPSKALLRSAEVYHTLKNAANFGVTSGEVGFDFTKVMERKNAIVSQLHKGIQQLMKSGAITVLEGTGTILQSDLGESPVRIEVMLNDGSGNEIVAAKHCIIATGSKPKSLPGLTIDGNQVITSDEALQLEVLPQSIIIVGGGIIGIEWASLLADFGVEVTVLEYADRIIPTEDAEISKEMLRLMKKRRIKVATGAKVLAESVEKAANQMSISAEVKGKIVSYTAEQMLVSVGRVACVDGFGLDRTGAKVDKGFIQVNEFYQTADPYFYAVGDVIGGLQLAHVASHEGITAVEHIAGQQVHAMDQNLVPKCIYSRPECANVGLSEEAAIAKGHQVKVGKFFFRAIGKALVYGDSDGFVKFVTDANSGELLGVHMIGAHVTEMITEAEIAMLLKATAWEVGQMIHPHPSMSEAVGEAALDTYGKAIHR